MIWYSLITAHIVFGAIMPIALRKYSLLYPKIHFIPVISIYICVAAVGVITAIGHTFVSGSQLPLINDYSNLWPLVGVGIFIPLSWTIQFRIIRYIGASNTAVALMTNYLAASVFAVVLLKESISTIFIVGSFFLLCGVVVSSFVRPDTKHKQRVSKLKIISLILLMSLSFGFGIMCEKIAIDDANVWTYIMYGWLSQLIGASIIIGIAGKKEIAKVTWPQARHGLLIGLLGALAGLTFVGALSISQLSNTVMATSAKVTLTAFLAAFLLKERNQIFLRILAIVLAIIGLWMIAK